MEHPAAEERYAADIQFATRWRTTTTRVHLIAANLGRTPAQVIDRLYQLGELTSQEYRLLTLTQT